MIHAKFVGMPTNDVNGDVTSVALPGDMHAFLVAATSDTATAGNFNWWESNPTSS